MKEPICNEKIKKALKWLDAAQREEIPSEAELREHTVPESLDDWFTDWMQEEANAEKAPSEESKESFFSRAFSVFRDLFRKPLPLAFMMFIGLGVIVNGIYNHRPIPSAFHYENHGTHIEIISAKTDNTNPILVSRTIPEGFESEIFETPFDYEEDLFGPNKMFIYLSIRKPGGAATMNYEGASDITEERVGKHSIHVYNIKEVKYCYWDDGSLFYSVIGNVDRTMLYDFIRSITANVKN